MKRHDTPHSVAAELAKHAPRELGRVLDPAVGAGALIAPLLRRLRGHRTQLYCVDIDAEAIAELQGSSTLQFPNSTTFVQKDFLKWSCQPGIPAFDCVVMNPPFAANRTDLRRTVDFGFQDSDRCVPLEAAFVMKAVQLLAPNGRLLAVLPCSLVMAEQCQWLRDWLLEQGAIRFIHELPPRTFPSVESRMYLIVFDKSVRSRKVILYNHDLYTPERLELSLDRSGEITRLDFGFHKARLNLDVLKKSPQLGWKKLETVATVFRGSVPSPIGPKTAIHTTDYKNGYWRKSTRHRVKNCNMKERRIRLGDILVARVGRECHLSFGRAVALTGLPCSDCVLIIRPKFRSESYKLLFALQTLFSFDWAKSLIERGTGATYVGQAGLLDVMLPMDLNLSYPKEYSRFLKGHFMLSRKQANQAVSDTVLSIQSP